MSPVVVLSLSACVAYLIGSIPFSMMIGKLIGGIDLRQCGSGNVGATNVARTMGAKWGAVALLCDAGKGMASVALIPLLLTVSEANSVHQQVLCAIFAVLGHMFSCWLKFRGGKGVATALGGVIILSPWATLVAFIGFAITFATTRIVSLASILAAIIFTAAAFIFSGEEIWSVRNWSNGAFSIAVPLLIIIRHRSNIRRLWKGEEPKLTFAKKDSDSIPLDGTDSPNK